MDHQQVRRPIPAPISIIQPTILTQYLLQRAEAIHMLDLKYRGTMHQTDLIVKDEEARRLKLRVIVLRDEVAVLRDQLAEKEDRISDVSQQYEDICAQLGRMDQTCKEQADQLRLQARQQSDLKVLPPASALLYTHGCCLLTKHRPSCKH